MTMQEMVMDQELGAHFVVLLLVKLGGKSGIDGSVTIYQPNKRPRLGNVIAETNEAGNAIIP